MVQYQLNEVEVARSDELCGAAQLLFGADCINEKTYCFTSTGVGVVVELELKLNKNIIVRKNITDYDSW